MEAFQRYFQSLSKKLEAAFEQEKEIRLASKWVAESIKSEGWIYTSGTGHSHLLAEEIFYRAGGFARVIPILEPSLMLHENAAKSSDIERTEGLAAQLLADYSISDSDVFIIYSNSGRNAVPIEMAQLAKLAGAKVICITNLAHTKSISSRHSSGLKLYQVSDLVLDNCGSFGDASIELEGLSTKVGATSTSVGSALVQAIMVQASQNLLNQGVIPDIFSSSNSDEGNEINKLLTEKYSPFVKLIGGDKTC